MNSPKIVPKTSHIENGITIYDYDKDEYINWRNRGERIGDVGLIIIAEDEYIIIFEGYGTEEKPITKKITIKAVKTNG